MTFVDRTTHCILNWAVDWHVTDENLQEILDGTLSARWYYSDLLAAYQELAYDFGIHFPMKNKSQTYSVEAGNSELRYKLGFPRYPVHLFNFASPFLLTLPLL